MVDQENRTVAVCHLGRAEYQPTWDLQKRIQARLILAKRSEPPQVLPHVMLTVEHPPVYTLGKSGQIDNLLASATDLNEIGASFERIDRGGDITFHGPGQLVVYPILDLGYFYTDIHRYLRELEEAVIRTCAYYGVDAHRVDGLTGVWIGPDLDGPERKVCAMGIKCSRWVTSHGLALNIATDLTYFGHIVPCGIPDRGVTSLQRETNITLPTMDVAAIFVQHFERVFKADTEQMSGPEAAAYLDGYLSRAGE